MGEGAKVFGPELLVFSRRFRGRSVRANPRKLFSTYSMFSRIQPCSAPKQLRGLYAENARKKPGKLELFSTFLWVQALRGSEAGYPE